MKRSFQGSLVIVLTVVSFCVCGCGQVAVSNGAGLSEERLGRIDNVINEYVDNEGVAGASVMIYRNGQVGYFKTFGVQDVEKDIPMQKDTIFRIYSMTKAITSTAVLMLQEEGYFFINDPVSKYLPELKGMKVGVEGVDPKTGEATFELVDAKREMTIRDLLRHTSGMPYGLFAKSRVDELYNEAGVLNGKTVATLVTKVSKMPLKHQPGEVWEYGVSTDVLGRLVEVVSGMTLEEFFKTRIFEPLGMEDTFFTVPADKAHRFAAIYSLDKDKKIHPAGPWVSRDYLKPTTFFSGGGGLASTQEDYLTFCKMILNDGSLNGVSILSPKTVELMTSDHIVGVNKECKGSIVKIREAGFGLGFRVNNGPNLLGKVGSVGTASWGGAASTNFFIDFEEEMIVIYMSQVKPADHTLGYKVEDLAYQAIID
jgi:CubicO group peptidase (beta-lactamase class C family)